MKVNYLIIFVSNMKVSIGFYKNILGLKLKFETTHRSEFEIERATIALYTSDLNNIDETSSGKVIASRYQPGVIISKLDEYHKQLVDDNVTCLREPKEKFVAGTVQYMDPDGLVITVSDQ